MKALINSFTWSVFTAVTVVLALSVVPVHAQTPGQIPMFDPLGTNGACNSAVGIECVDSVIHQGANGNIGIGTTTPAGKLDVAGGNVNLENSGPLTGNILKGGVLFLHNFGSSNTFLGLNAGNLTLTGYGNTATGEAVLQSNTTGSWNTASGSYALPSNTTGSGNTASGLWALRDNTTGSWNTAAGYDALLANTTGMQNTASGSYALGGNTAGNNNTAIGAGALRGIFGNTGNANTVVGADALPRNTTADFNTAIGYQALYNNQIGFENIAIGAGAGSNVTGYRNILIGSFGIAGESNAIRIGRFFHRFFSDPIANTLVAGQPVVINGDGLLGVQPSSRRFKRDIRDIGEASSGLMRLRPVTFYYNDADVAGPRQPQYGLIAEEVAEVYPDLVAYDRDGQPEAVHYHFINALLLNEVQKQHRRQLDQQQEIVKQQQAIEKLQILTAENVELKARLDALERLVKQTQTASR